MLPEEKHSNSEKKRYLKSKISVLITLIFAILEIIRRFILDK